ncbi:MAG: protocatechuate 3,4-dioxygenase beta subunit [Planctomycetota bacterium]|jgi:protocatechuate 3,4-dioxygenase beta subunit
MKKLFVFVVVLVLVAVTWFAVADNREKNNEGVYPDTHVEDASVVLQSNEEPEQEFMEVAANGERVMASDVEQAPTSMSEDGEASLRVRVYWSDGLAAEGVGVILSPRGKSRARRQLERQVTDPEGFARFEHLTPGTVEVLADRGAEGGEQELELKAGEKREVDLRLLAGVDVVGQVVDASAVPVAVPVAGASIWLTSPTARWTKGRVVAKSDANGRFTLRDVPDSQSIVAMAAGFQQSLPVDLDVLDTTVQPVQVTLMLGIGGASLVGRVFNFEGVPIPGALVAVGESPGHLDVRGDNTIVEKIEVRTARGDAQGAFRFDSLKAGELRVRVRAPGAPLWSSLIQIQARETNELDVRLTQGARVQGVVRDGDGAPVEGAWVHAFEVKLDETFLSSGQIDYEGAFRHPVGVSGSNGHYLVTSVTPGSVHLYALSPQKRDGRREDVVYDKRELEVGPGESASWDPTLDGGNIITGTVLYQNGEPMVGVFVSAAPLSGGDRRSFFSEDGAFRFVRLDDEPHDLRAQVWDLPGGGNEPQLKGVVPNGEPIELIADFDPPSAFEEAEVRVHFVDEAGRAENPSRIEVVLESKDRLSWWEADKDGDTWLFGVGKAGAARAVALFGERTIAIGDYIEIESGGSYDLHLSSQAGGTILVRFERDEGQSPVDWLLWVEAGGTRRSEQIDIGPGRELRLDSLEPGPGKMTLLGSNVMDLEAEFEVIANEERIVTLQTRAAIGVPFKVSWTTSIEDKALTIRISHRDSGKRVVDVETADSTRYQNPILWTATLAPGAYTFEVFTGAGKRHAEDFEVESLDPDKIPTLEADLR